MMVAASPALTMVLMLFEAGLLAEWKTNQRHGSDPAFVAYKQQTSLLWPVPPALYSSLPAAARAVFFFDWALYRWGLPGQKRAPVKSVFDRL